MSAFFTNNLENNSSGKHAIEINYNLSATKAPLATSAYPTRPLFQDIVLWSNIGGLCDYRVILNRRIQNSCHKTITFHPSEQTKQ